MPRDPELQWRGRLIRRLVALREMLPGSFVERQRACGKPHCRCADGQHLHPQYQLSVLAEGRLQTYHVPAAEAAQVRRRVDLHRRFQRAAAMITSLNLRRWLRQRKSPKREK
jgi:hypothetical protein